jgi:hypothetical protein
MSKTAEKRAEKRRICSKKKFWFCRSLFGYNDTYFWLIVGPRDYGKSYSVLDRFIREFKTEGKPFYWLRLTDKIAQAMLQNDAIKFIDADLRRKYDLELTVKGNDVFDHGVKMAEIMGISNFYNMKGTASFDCEWKKGYNICLDECQRESGEAVRFDINTALINSLETYVRDTKKKLRIVFICNYTETLADIVNLFNFMPEKPGIYKLKKKKAVVYMMPLTQQYIERRKDTVATILAPNSSSFTNTKIYDKSLITKERLVKPKYVIVFEDEKYTVWQGMKNGDIIREYNGENVAKVAMKRALPGCMYRQAAAKVVCDLFDLRGFHYASLITEQRFILSLAKNKKN